jgi:hypothetical protein
MAILGAAQSDFDKIFGGSQVFHDPRLFPRWDILESLMLMNHNNNTLALNSAAYHNVTSNHGAVTVCAATADSYNTLADISGGAGIMSYAYGPHLTVADGTITFKFTVDGTVYTVATHSSGTNSRGVLGGFIWGSGSTWESLSQLLDYNTLVDSNESVVRIANSSAYNSVCPPTMAMAGGWGSLPILGWTDSFKLEVKSSTTMGTDSGPPASNQYHYAGVGYYLL